MKKTILLLTLITTILSNVANAQWGTWVNDSVAMAPGITNDVFYNFTTRTVKTEGNSNWLLALGTSFSTAGIWANHSAGVKVYRTGKHVSQWSTITLADTTQQLYNPDTSWDYGALNAKSAGIYDYGWGNYNTTVHNVYGDSIFIIGQGANYYQLVIDSMKGFTNDYYMRISPMGMSSVVIPYTFAKAPKFSNSNFIYVRSGSMGLADTAREPANNSWDILFTKYTTQVPIGGGATAPYNVMGVLSNRGLNTCRIQNVDLGEVATTYNNYTLNKKINNIGYDWKVFAGTAFSYPDSLSYLVKSVDSSLYQIKFTGYSSATGIVQFKTKKLAAPLNVSGVTKQVNSMSIYPNPVLNEALVSLEINKSSTAVLSLIDMQGKIVNTKNITLTNGLNAINVNMQNVQNGNYILQIANSEMRTSKLITKQ